MSTGDRMDMNFLVGKDDSKLQNEWSAVKQANAKIDTYNSSVAAREILTVNIASIYNRIAMLSQSTNQEVKDRALKDMRELSATIQTYPELLKALQPKITDKRYIGRRSEIIGAKRSSIRKSEIAQVSDKQRFDAFIKDFSALKETTFKKDSTIKAFISNYCENVLTASNLKSKVDELKRKIPDVADIIAKHYPELDTGRRSISGKKHT